MFRWSDLGLPGIEIVGWFKWKFVFDNYKITSLTLSTLFFYFKLGV